MPFNLTCAYCCTAFVAHWSGRRYCSRSCAATNYPGRTRRRRPLIDRLLSRVDKNGPVPEHRPELGPCWVWTASSLKNGYGNLRVNGRSDTAHRVSWIAHYGPIPDGLWVLHKCDNRICCRPDHLFLGTAQDNTDDMWEKGRQGTRSHHRGEDIYGAKLNPDLVREIRARYAEGGVSVKELARAYRVSDGTIASLVTRQTWAHIDPEGQPIAIRKTVGENNRAAKLTEAVVLDIRARYAAGGTTYRALADEFGVSYSTVHFIVSRQRWAHI